MRGQRANILVFAGLLYFPDPLVQPVGCFLPQFPAKVFFPGRFPHQIVHKIQSITGFIGGQRLGQRYTLPDRPECHRPGPVQFP